MHALDHEETFVVGAGENPKISTSPCEDRQYSLLVSKDGHWVAVQIITSPRSLADVPDILQVCQSLIVPCCGQLPGKEIECYILDAICSGLEPGTWARGRCCIFSADGPLDATCERKAREALRSFLVRPAASPHSSKRKRAGTAKGKEKQKKGARQNTSATEDDVGTNGENSIPDKDDLSVDDKALAEKVANRLVTAVKSAWEEDNNPQRWQGICGPPTVQVEPPERTGVITELEKSLLACAEKTTKDVAVAGCTYRMLHSYCRILQKGAQLPLSIDPDVSKQDTQQRHEDGFMVLSWIITDLYESRKSLALVLFRAVLGKVYHKGYVLSELMRVGISRRRRIAKLVVLTLRYEPIVVAEDSLVLHPAIYLKYHQRQYSLLYICKHLHLPNLELSDAEVEQYAWGAPIRLLLSRDRGSRFWVSLDENRSVHFLSDSIATSLGQTGSTQHLLRGADGEVQPPCREGNPTPCGTLIPTPPDTSRPDPTPIMSPSNLGANAYVDPGMFSALSGFAPAIDSNQAENTESQQELGSAWDRHPRILDVDGVIEDDPLGMGWWSLGD